MNEDRETSAPLPGTVAFLTAAQKAHILRERSRRPVVLTPELTVYVRSVGIDEVLSASKLPPDLIVPGEEEEVVRKRIVEYLFADDRIESCFDIVITKGMAEPRVWTGDGACPYDDGYVLLEDLAEHRSKLFGAIFNGGKKSREAVAAATFPGADGTGTRPLESGEDVGPDPGAVPDADGSG